MKFISSLLIIALAAHLVQSQAPSPIPVASVDLNLLKGNWWVDWQYDYQNNNDQNTNYTCWSWNIKLAANGKIQLQNNFTENGQKQSYDYVLTHDAKNSTWDARNFLQYILYLDPISYSYLLVGSDIQNAILLTRNPSNLSNLIVATAMTVLKAEKYYANSTNTYNIINANCN